MDSNGHCSSEQWTLNELIYEPFQSSLFFVVASVSRNKHEISKMDPNLFGSQDRSKRILLKNRESSRTNNIRQRSKTTGEVKNISFSIIPNIDQRVDGSENAFIYLRKERLVNNAVQSKLS